MPRRRAALAILLATLGGIGGAAAAPAAPAAVAKKDLTPEQRQWLEEEDLLIRKEEKKQFFALAGSYQRDQFIRDWWKARDPDPATPRNEFKAAWEARLDEVRGRYGNLTEDRARTFLLHGEPAAVRKTDCSQALWPLEIWTYAGGQAVNDRLPRGFVLVFVQPSGVGPFRLWRPAEGFDALEAMKGGGMTPGEQSEASFLQLLQARCNGEVYLRDGLWRAVQLVVQEEQSSLLELAYQTPGPRDTEWLATFRSGLTDLSPGAATLAAHLDLGFPGSDGGQTLVQGLLAVPKSAAKLAQLSGQGTYSFLLNGEVLREGALLESFRYRFDVPAAGLGDVVPVAFERRLRPGSYELVVKLDDLAGGRSYRERRAIEVPKVAAVPPDPAVAAGLAAAGKEMAEAADGAELRILPLAGPLAGPAGAGGTTGPLRVEAAARGDAIRKVAFYLDGKALLTKARPPWSVDVNLGDLPTPHTVRAVGLDEAGREVAADELEVNAAQQRFAVRLLEPRAGTKRPARARAEVRVPDGRALDRVELFLDDRRVATLYQAPFLQPLAPAGAPAHFVRAVAYLKDGESAEATVLLDAPGYVEHLDVHLVEVYAAVKDAAHRPLTDLKAADFTVKDAGVPQALSRCERMTDLPISAALLIDTSSSMAKSLPQAQRAALAFVDSLSPKDRAAVIPFNERPLLAVKLTGDAEALHRALAGVQAVGGTAIYDSLIFALHYLQGVRGERAILLLTDGGDRASQYSFEESLGYARRAGVTIYSIGLGIGKLDLVARTHLAKLAAETGGRSWFVDSASDLQGVYAEIGEDLRSRYLLAYQPSNAGKPGEFHPVAVQVDRPGVEVEAMTGYFP
jgi:VWFA-related protein